MNIGKQGNVNKRNCFKEDVSMLWIQIWIRKYLLLFWKIGNLKQDLCKLFILLMCHFKAWQMVFDDMRWGLHMLLICYLSILNSCIWHKEWSSGMIFPNRVFTLCFGTLRKRGKHALGNLQIKSSLTKGRKLCNWWKFRPLGVSLVAYNAKLFRW